MVAEFIFEDNGVKDLIANFYQNGTNQGQINKWLFSNNIFYCFYLLLPFFSSEWIEGEITECLIATFGDYFSDAEK